jgi:hypothetical protein
MAEGKALPSRTVIPVWPRRASSRAIEQPHVPAPIMRMLLLLIVLCNHVRVQRACSIEVHRKRELERHCVEELPRAPFATDAAVA